MRTSAISASKTAKERQNGHAEGAVTLITGYGAENHLLNRILTEQHGKKYAVIVNEFGEEGIDNDLVVDADEEIFEMNNGCICCTVRGDLIRIISISETRTTSMG